MPQYWFAASTGVHPARRWSSRPGRPRPPASTALAASDHFAPWFPDGQASQAWVTLGALGQVTTKPIGTGVTPIVHHYHPGLVAQAFMSLECLYPGRVFLGAGSGESVNESPLGLDWPPVADQQDRFAAGRGDHAAVGRGDRDDGRRLVRAQGGEAVDPRAVAAKLYVSAFGPQAAQIAARYGDGCGPSATPSRRPRSSTPTARRAAARGREPGEIILQTGIAWAADEAAAIDGRGTLEADAAARALHRRHLRPGGHAAPGRRADVRRAVRQGGLHRRRRPGGAPRAHPRDGAARGDRDLPAAHRPGRPDGDRSARTASGSCPRCAACAPDAAQAKSSASAPCAARSRASSTRRAPRRPA